MQREKEFVATPHSEVECLLDNLTSRTAEELADKRELLRDFYLEYMDNVCRDLNERERKQSKNLYWYMDELLKNLYQVYLLKNKKNN